MRIIKSVLVLLASLAIGLTSWVTALQTWQDALVPGNMGPALGIAGSIVLAWVGVSPIKSKQ